MRYLYYALIVINILINANCIDTPSTNSDISPVRNKIDPILEQEQKRIEESIAKVYQNINVLGVSTYVDENLNTKTKFIIKNISNKTITNIVIGHMIFHQSGESIKVLIKPGQSKTILANVKASSLGADGSSSNYEVIFVRFSDGSAVGTLK